MAYQGGAYPSLWSLTWLRELILLLGWDYSGFDTSFSSPLQGVQHYFCQTSDKPFRDSSQISPQSAKRASCSANNEDLVWNTNLSTSVRPLSLSHVLWYPWNLISVLNCFNSTFCSGMRRVLQTKSPTAFPVPPPSDVTSCEIMSDVTFLRGVATFGLYWCLEETLQWSKPYLFTLPRSQRDGG